MRRTLPPDDGRPNSWVGVFFAVATTALGAQPVWILAAFAPTISAELGFSETFLGVTIGVFFAVSTIIGLPIGRAIHRLGWRPSVVAMMFVSAVTLVAVGTLSRGALDLLLIIAVGAVANSASQPIGNLAVASSVDAARQGRAFGLKQAALPVSTLIVGLSVPLFGGGEYWRAAFVVGGLLAAAVGLAALRPSDRDRVARALSSWSRAGEQTRSHRGHGLMKRPPARSLPRILTLLAISAGLGTAVTTAIGGFVVVYGSSVGLSPIDAARLLVIGSIVGIVVRLAIGVVADVMTSRHLLLVAAMMSGGALGLTLMSVAAQSPALLVVGVVVTFGSGWAWNGLFHYAVVRYSPIPPALATSIVWAAMSFGAALGPMLFGVMAAVSYTLAWLAAAVGLLAAASFMALAHLGLSETRSSARPPTPPSDSTS